MSMQSTANPTQSHDLTTRYILPFFLLTFALSWGLLFGMLLYPEAMLRIFGELSVTNPAYITATWAPGLVGIGLVLFATGFSGLKRYFGRLFDFRQPLAWWAFVLLGLPLVKMASAALNGTPLSGMLVFDPLGEVVMITAFMLFLGPVEEFGWRGVALPLMQRTMAPVWAGLIIGFVWAFWHIPAFFLDGTPHTAWSLTPFLIGVTSVGVVMAVVYNKTRGNLLFAVLIHWQLNIAFWPEAQPWENYLNLILAVVLVWIHRDVMLHGHKAETTVVPGH
ncbi:CPBP family intramembrane glutamic endopeptidase [Yoonia sp.]|uniref:CPBP family intramembrane glutamic endopeptidase n=1 Tax=Yoonia sp. TaxID=2212373 RepID=UPI00358F09AF